MATGISDETLAEGIEAEVKAYRSGGTRESCDE